jgi:hypothetical protein
MQAVTMSHLVEEYEDDDTEQIPGNDQGGLEQFPEWMLETPEGRRARTFGECQSDKMIYTTRKVF